MKREKRVTKGVQTPPGTFPLSWTGGLDKWILTGLLLQMHSWCDWPGDCREVWAILQTTLRGLLCQRSDFTFTFSWRDWAGTDVHISCHPKTNCRNNDVSVNFIKTVRLYFCHLIWNSRMKWGTVTGDTSPRPEQLNVCCAVTSWVIVLKAGVRWWTSCIRSNCYMRMTANAAVWFAAVCVCVTSAALPYCKY